MTGLKGAEIGPELLEFFEQLFAAAKDQTKKLSTWEHDFLADVETRFEAHGENFRCSPKQWEIFTRIGGKLGVKP